MSPPRLSSTRRRRVTPSEAESAGARVQSWHFRQEPCSREAGVAAEHLQRLLALGLLQRPPLAVAVGPAGPVANPQAERVSPQLVRLLAVQLTVRSPTEGCFSFRPVVGQVLVWSPTEGCFSFWPATHRMLVWSAAHRMLVWSAAEDSATAGVQCQTACVCRCVSCSSPVCRKKWIKARMNSSKTTQENSGERRLCSTLNVRTCSACARGEMRM